MPANKKAASPIPEPHRLDYLIISYLRYFVYACSNTACAAANLAIGTRKGEQLT